MRLTLIIYSLSAGGAERVMSILANYWAEKGWPVTLLTFDDGREHPFYHLHPAIIHRPLGIAEVSSNAIQGLLNNLKRIWLLRRAIKTSAPQITVSFMSRVNVQVLLASLGLKIPVVVSERSVPSHLSLGTLWNFLRTWSYSRSSCLIVQSQSVLTYFSKIPKLQSRVIPNPVIELDAGEPDQKQKGFDRKEKVLLSMGRLHEVKGYDLLLMAFAKVAQKHGDWTLVIWGEGPERVSLEKLRDDLRIKDRVQFPGLTKTPSEEMKQADLFVLSSRCEGFPNVICEAFICGLPVISFDCPFGPGEIIREGIDGILVPPEDVDALAATLDRLMENGEERNRLAKRAPEVLERFDLEKIMGMWEEVLTSPVTR